MQQTSRYSITHEIFTSEVYPSEEVNENRVENEPHLNEMRERVNMKNREITIKMIQRIVTKVLWYRRTKKATSSYDAGIIS